MFDLAEVEKGVAFCVCFEDSVVSLANNYGNAVAF
jgi:hypothetical protein